MCIAVSILGDGGMSGRHGGIIRTRQRLCIRRVGDNLGAARAVIADFVCDVCRIVQGQRIGDMTTLHLQEAGEGIVRRLGAVQEFQSSKVNYVACAEKRDNIPELVIG